MCVFDSQQIVLHVLVVMFLSFGFFVLSHGAVVCMLLRTLHGNSLQLRYSTVRLHDEVLLVLRCRGATSTHDLRTLHKELADSVTAVCSSLLHRLEDHGLVLHWMLTVESVR